MSTEFPCFHKASLFLNEINFHKFKIRKNQLLMMSYKGTLKKLNIENFQK